MLKRQYFGYTGLSKMCLNHLFLFTFLNVATRQFRITDMARSVFNYLRWAALLRASAWTRLNPVSR